MMYMLDTNICIYIIKRRPPEIIEKFRTFSVSEIAISSVTLAELEYGVCKSQHSEKNWDALALFVSPLNILSFDSLAAVKYGEIRAKLEKEGRIIGAMDMLIAAHAMSLGLTLVTNNTNEFERIDGLTFENWS
ncbi:type II toxin-antitoxin system tRNA(fMet)-specific endonuclease VapC [Seleniivibrio woodruffii]|uniref:type II toxin-antitoxin system tRNA(fMet)-specific endonuclease VapC n=1 Tax=Seleniivibrio woodruffii TaxID=1078050 RepID=UPI003C6F599F